MSKHFVVKLKQVVQSHPYVTSFSLGEHVILVERKTEERWLVRKTITREKGIVPKSILQDVASYNQLLDQVLEEKIGKLPVFGSKYLCLLLVCLFYFLL